MKKVCENWRPLFPADKTGAHHFDEFKKRATNVSAEVFRVSTFAEANAVINDLIEKTQARKVIAVNCPIQEAANVHDKLKALGIEFYTEPTDIAAHADTADIGLSGVEFGIAETGSLCQDAYAIESRLVSTLPPIHVAFLHTANILPGVKEAFDVISQTFNQGYISFISGPSRTADIERVLTIGVHGPSRLVIIAVDEELNGGVA